MQVQTVSNSKQNAQNFTGGVQIVNDLSYNPCKYVRRAYDAMSELVKDKPYDIFVNQDYANESLSLIVSKPKHAYKSSKRRTESTILNAPHLDSGDATTDLYVAVAKDAVAKYEKFFPKKSFVQNLKDIWAETKVLIRQYYFNKDV